MPAKAEAPKPAIIYPYLAGESKETIVDVSATLTSKGQVTIPKAVRKALDLNAGDQLLFRVEEGRAVVAKTGDFLAMAGSVPVPPGKRGLPWDEVRRRTRATRARRWD
jgi:AbrB family looped-hinge helix DNA binding protein